MKRWTIVAVVALGACDNKYDQMKQQAAASASVAAAASASALAQALAQASASASAPPPKDDKPPEWIMAEQVLVAYKGADKCPRKVTRSKEEARKRADEAHARAVEGQMDFGDIAKLYSDDPSGAERQGSMGRIDRQSVVKPFGDAAFALKVDGISPVVETQFGFHVIKRTQ
jgi:hypothetical protein